MAPRRETRLSRLELGEGTRSNEVHKLRERLAALVGVVQQQAEISRRQAEQIDRLQGLLAQQTEAARTARGRAASPRVGATVEDTVVTAEPMSARPAHPVGVTREVPHRADLVAFDAEYAAQKAEQDRAMEGLASFQRFNPPTFTGKGSDPMIVESWVDSMEKLFSNLRIPDRDRVARAVPFLDGMAHRWWKIELEGRTRAALPTPTWEEFKELLFAKYFPDSAKQQMEEDFRGLRQGSRSVQEYEYEFARIVSCLSSVVRSEWIKHGVLSGACGPVFT